MPPQPRKPLQGLRSDATLPIGLIALWLTAELLAALASGLQFAKPGPQALLAAGEIAIHAAGALIAGRALAALVGEAQAMRWLPILAGLVAIGSAFTAVRAPDVATLSGLALGSAGWLIVARWHEPRRSTSIVVLLFAAYAIGALAPFEIRDAPEPFSLVPFAGFLRGSLLANSKALAANLCLYAAILWLVRMNRISPVPSSVALAVLVTLFEAIHIFIANRIPDITEPLLVLLLGQSMRLAPASRSHSKSALRTPSRPAYAPEPRPTSNAPSRASGPSRAMWLAVLAYGGLIFYASLYPLVDWRMPEKPFWSFLGEPWPRWFSRADILSNVVAYVPLGLLLSWQLRHRLGPLAAILAACLTGTLLSLCVETVQMFLPSRTSSQIDLLTNAIGTLIGGCLGEVFGHDANLPRRLRALRDEWFQPGLVSGAGIAAIVLWALAQLSPFVPSLDMGTLREGLSALRGTFLEISLFRSYDATAYGLNIAGLGLLVASLLRPGRPLVLPFAAFVSLVLVLKPFMVSRQLSLEAVSGLALGVTALMLLRHLPRTPMILGAATLLLGGFAAAELSPGSGALQPFNWIPFAGEIENNINGFSNILAGVWPFLAVGCLVNLVAPPSRRFQAMVAGAAVMAIFAFLLEWNQQFLPGRHGDVTTMLLAIGGWLVPWQGQAGEVRT